MIATLAPVRRMIAHHPPGPWRTPGRRQRHLIEISDVIGFAVAERAGGRNFALATSELNQPTAARRAHRVASDRRLGPHGGAMRPVSGEGADGLHRGPAADARMGEQGRAEAAHDRGAGPNRAVPWQPARRRRSAGWGRRPVRADAAPRRWWRKQCGWRFRCCTGGTAAGRRNPLLALVRRAGAHPGSRDRRRLSGRRRIAAYERRR